MTAAEERYRCPVCGHWCNPDGTGGWICSKRRGCGSEWPSDWPGVSDDGAEQSSTLAVEKVAEVVARLHGNQTGWVNRLDRDEARAIVAGFGPVVSTRERIIEMLSEVARRWYDNTPPAGQRGDTLPEWQADALLASGAAVDEPYSGAYAALVMLLHERDRIIAGLTASTSVVDREDSRRARRSWTGRLTVADDYTPSLTRLRNNYAHHDPLMEEEFDRAMEAQRREQIERDARIAERGGLWKADAAIREQKP
jgi:hypothetical protein